MSKENSERLQHSQTDVDLPSHEEVEDWHLKRLFNESYFVNVGIALDGNKKGEFRIKNLPGATFISFTCTRHTLSATRTREKAWNQDYVFKDGERLQFFRFLLYKEPFATVVKEFNNSEEIFEGITTAAGDDFLPVPRIQLTLVEHGVDSFQGQDVDETEIDFLELSDQNLDGLVAAIDEEIDQRMANQE